MKKIIFLVSAFLAASLQAIYAQEITQEQVDEAFDKLNEQINTTVDTVVQPAVEAIGSALGSMVDTFTHIHAIAEVCKDEDQKSGALTKEKAEAVIKCITPDNLSKFAINPDATTGDNFASGNFEINQSNANLELMNSYCLCMVEDMAKAFDDIPQNTAKAVSDAFPEAKDSDGLNKASENESSSQLYIIGGDNINADKFRKSNRNGMEIMEAFDEEKNTAYTIGSIGTLSIKAKISGEGYKEVSEKFWHGIDVNCLKSVIGSESIAEIQAKLRKKVKIKLDELQKQTAKTEN